MGGRGHPRLCAKGCLDEGSVRTRLSLRTFLGERPIFPRNQPAQTTRTFPVEQDLISGFLLSTNAFVWGSLGRGRCRREGRNMPAGCPRQSSRTPYIASPRQGLHGVGPHAHSPRPSKLSDCSSLEAKQKRHELWSWLDLRFPVLGTRELYPRAESKLAHDEASSTRLQSPGHSYNALPWVFPSPILGSREQSSR